MKNYYVFVISLVLVLFNSLTYAFSTSGMDGPVGASGQGRSGGITVTGMGGDSSGANGTQYAKLSPSPQEQQLQRRINEIRKRVERMPAEETMRPERKATARQPAQTPQPSAKKGNPYIGKFKSGYLRFYESQVPNWLGRLDRTEQWRPTTKSAASSQGVEPKLVHVIAAYESGGNPEAVSPKGATGLMQLMPKTADFVGVKNRKNPAECARGGAWYLRYLYGVLGNNWENAILGYYMGDEGARRYLKNKKATDHWYVRHILAMYELHG